MNLVSNADPGGEGIGGTGTCNPMSDIDHYDWLGEIPDLDNLGSPSDATIVTWIPGTDEFLGICRPSTF